MTQSGLHFEVITLAAQKRMDWRHAEVAESPVSRILLLVEER